MDFRDVSVADLATRVHAKELSARELVGHALDRIDALDRHLGAFTAVDGDRALADAARIDEWIAAGEQVGALAGIPIGVKDLEHAAGFVTTYGSAVHAGDAPAEIDSVLVSRLRAAGCIVVGKTNTPEHGFKGVTDNPVFGPSRNPWDRERTPGGSSGGSASAIAAGMIPLATGSDGGGSIRIPASICGLSGFKPSQGRVPAGGPTPPGAGVLSTKGPMTRGVRDAALVLDACVGAEPTDLASFPGLHDPWAPQLDDVGAPERIVYSPTMWGAAVDHDVAAAVETAVERLAAAGTEVVVVDQVFEADPTLAWFRLWCAYRARSQGHLRDTPSWELIDPDLRSMIDYGEQLGAVEVVEALDACHLLNHRLETEVFSHAPLLVCPTIAGRPPAVGAAQGTVDGEDTPGWVAFTPWVNLTRNPAGSVACGVAPDGLPVGLQVIGRQREDLSVLAAMAAAEDLFADLVPPLPEVL